MKQRLLSGIQPSGELHLGNYIGAIKQWKQFQTEYDSFFCIVDLHAITVRQEPVQLRENIRRLAATYIACGIDPEESTIFVQSSVHEHAELAWVLNTFTQMGELERMTQFKDKSKQHAQNINAGLFTYPALMAADILLYDTQMVPVGDDQKQHIELTRNIAERVNNHYGNDVFVVPEGFFPEQGARVMGLDDPSKKMSKSAASEYNYISFLDAPDVILKKVKKAVTDSGSDIVASDEKPAVKNLLTIYSEVAGKTIADLEKAYEGRGYGDFKKELGEAIVAFIEPVQKRVDELLADSAELNSLLDRGAAKASAVAADTMKRVTETIGLGYK